MRNLIVHATQTPGIGRVNCPKCPKGEVYLVKQCHQCPYFFDEALLNRKKDCVQIIMCNWPDKIEWIE